MLSKRKITFIIIFVLLLIICSLTYVLIIVAIGLPINDNNEKYSNLVAYFFKAILIAPLIETVFFQFIPIEFLRILKINNRINIFITAFVFGLMHYFNSFLLREFLFTFVCGFIYSYVYILYSKKFNLLNTITTVSIIHAGYNLFVFSLKALDT